MSVWGIWPWLQKNLIASFGSFPRWRRLCELLGPIPLLRERESWPLPSLTLSFLRNGKELTTWWAGVGMQNSNCSITFNCLSLLFWWCQDKITLASLSLRYFYKVGLLPTLTCITTRVPNSTGNIGRGTWMNASISHSLTTQTSSPQTGRNSQWDRISNFKLCENLGAPYS